jgi:raffinose/stachyose/melibiose transport system permease protein
MYKKLTLKLFLLLVPALAFFVAFIVVPILNAVRTSLLKWNGLSTPVFVGLHNWATQLSGPGLYQSLLLTAIVMVASWVVQTPLSFAIGLYLSKESRSRNALSIFYFTPLLFSAAALGIAWGFILNPNFGLLEAIGSRLFGLTSGADLLGNTKIVLYTLIGIIAWEFIPFHTLLYQSAARGIPSVLYEAAELDGATPWQKLRAITVPQMKNTIITSSVIILTGSLTYFDIIYVLTDGGPGNASRVLSLDMYQKAFEEYQMGVGATIAVILAIIGLALSLALVRWSGFTRMQSQMEGV